MMSYLFYICILGKSCPIYVYMSIVVYWHQHSFQKNSLKGRYVYFVLPFKLRKRAYHKTLHLASLRHSLITMMRKTF